VTSSSINLATINTLKEANAKTPNLTKNPSPGRKNKKRENLSSKSALIKYRRPPVVGVRELKAQEEGIAKVGVGAAVASLVKLKWTKPSSKV
jgi:hypothetical protein